MTKLKDRIEAARQRRGHSAPGPTKATPAASKWTWLIALAIIALAGTASYAGVRYFVLTRIPHVLIGTWVVTDVKTSGSDRSNEALKGGRMHFHRDGRMIVQANMDGKGYTIKANVEVEGNEMRITSVNPNNGQTATDVQTVRTLEGDRFVIEDSKGTMLMMERLRE
jgi:hypothetical protein